MQLAGIGLIPNYRSQSVSRQGVSFKSGKSVPKTLTGDAFVSVLKENVAKGKRIAAEGDKALANQGKDGKALYEADQTRGRLKKEI